MAPVRAKRKAWLAAAGGVLVLLLAGYVLATLRYCDAFGDISRRSPLFHLCSMGSEPIASVPVIEPVGKPTYSRRLADGMKPGLHYLRYRSTRSATEVRGILESYLTSHGFTLARREPQHDWWADHRSEMGLSTRATGERTCEVEVVHDTGYE